MNDDFIGTHAGSMQRENVLLFVAELEGAIRGGPLLTAEDAKHLPERLILSAAVYRRAAN